jgi:hypothetical protein
MNGTGFGTAAVRAMVAASLVAAALAAPPAARAQAVDHSMWDRLLQAHVDERGLVDYDAFALNPRFEEYLRRLARTDPVRLPRAEQLALWINAYNAYTIELINRHGERRSIRNINRALGLIARKGPWSERMATVGGRTYTLDEIEHEIIRPRFEEPRIHFTLVCAAIGCPALRREAYTGARLDAQLEDQARGFLRGSPAKNRVDLQAQRVYLSPIFRWYREDFGRDDAEVGRYLARFHDGAERELLLGGVFRIDYTPYDWTLNSPEHASRVR